MKMNWIRFAALISGFLSAGIALEAQLAAPITTKEFMREKLKHSQKLLEALALEDYFALTQESQKLRALTDKAKWQAFQNPDYDHFSAAFRRHVDALAKAAKEKDLDAATLAYVRVTMSCVDCHKFVRGKLIGSIERPPKVRAALRCAPTGG